jgi:hypothetical protein
MRAHSRARSGDRATARGVLPAFSRGAALAPRLR